MPEENNKPNLVTPPISIPIASRLRWLCGSLGGLLIIYAAVVILRGREGLGTVALVVLAGVLLILSVAGFVPRRIKAGDNEVEMWRLEVEDAAKEVADVAVDHMTPDEKSVYASKLAERAIEGDPSGVKSAAATRAQESADFEKRIEHYLAGGLPPGSFQAGTSDEGVDFDAINGITKVGIDAQLEFNTRKPWLFRAWLKIEQKKLDGVVVAVRGFTQIAEANLWLNQHAKGANIAICNDDPATIVWLVNYFLGHRQAPTHINTVIASAAPLTID